MSQTAFPHRFGEMTDAEITAFLMALVAGKDASQEKPVVLASQDWPKAKDGRPDVTRLPAIIMLGSKSPPDAGGRYAGTWWDFGRCLADIRAHFPYKGAPCAG